MEYTDAPTSEMALAADPRSCPVCGYTLPGDAKHCPHCNWVRGSSAGETAEGQASDVVAVILSVIPGLGHVYKGQRLLGLIFVIGAFGAVLGGALAATATAGFGLFLIPIYWFAVMFHVYSIEDRVAPNVVDEGEEY